MTTEEKRLEALKVLNDHFRYESPFELLSDRQVKLVLNAMEEYTEKQVKFISINNPVMRSACEHDWNGSPIDGVWKCNKCGFTDKG